MPLFESYDRRIKQINEALAKYGIGSIEEAEQLCLSKGINPREIVNGIQPIAFENADWAYVVGAAIASTVDVEFLNYSLSDLAFYMFLAGAVISAFVVFQTIRRLNKDDDLE